MAVTNGTLDIQETRCFYSRWQTPDDLRARILDFFRPFHRQRLEIRLGHVNSISKRLLQMRYAVTFKWAAITMTSVESGGGFPGGLEMTDTGRVAKRGSFSNFLRAVKRCMPSTITQREMSSNVGASLLTTERRPAHS
jgi:hypothetical protein